MKKRILHITAVLLTLIVFVQCLVLSSAAASDKITVSAPSVIQPDETFKAVISVSAGSAAYGVNGSVTLSEGLELVKSEKLLSGDWKTEINAKDGTVYFAAADQKQNSPISGKAKLISLTLKATGELGDDVKITVKNAYTADNGSLNSLSDAVLSRTLGAQSDDSEDGDGSYDGDSDSVDENGLSNNNLLKSLTVANAEIAPEFDPEVKVYKTTVPFDVKELEVEAEAQDEKATVTVENTTLKYVGNNIVRIRVVSESGLKRTYKIHTTREDKVKSSANAVGGLSALQIVLICVGAALILAAIAVLIILILKKRKKKQA